MVLKGTKDKTRIVEAKILGKLANIVSQLFMIRMLPAEGEGVEGIRETHPQILTLTDEYHQLFSDLKELPLFRGIFLS